MSEGVVDMISPQWLARKTGTLVPRGKLFLHVRGVSVAAEANQRGRAGGKGFPHRGCVAGDSEVSASRHGLHSAGRLCYLNYITHTLPTDHMKEPSGIEIPRVEKELTEDKKGLAERALGLADEIGDIVDLEMRDRLVTGPVTPLMVSELASRLRKRVFQEVCDIAGIDSETQSRVIDG